MANLTAGSALAEIGTLFVEGTAAGQTDGQVLDRFLARRDPLAFEALWSVSTSSPSPAASWPRSWWTMP